MNRGNTEFTSVENKGRLWKMLQENGAFNGIRDDEFTKFHSKFESIIVSINNQHSSKTVMVKSKLFIDEMIQYISMQKSNPNTNPNANAYANANPNAYTAKDIKAANQESFNTELSKQQNDFNKFNQKDAPLHIDFEDKDNEMDDDINMLLEKAERDREILVLPKVVDPMAKVVDPMAKVVEPMAKVVEPTAKVVEPMAKVVEPTANVVEPMANVVEMLHSIIQRLDKQALLFHVNNK